MRKHNPIFAATVVAATLVGAMTSSTADAKGSVKCIVLVHSAWANGSGWEGVYDILRKDGYNVSVVANPDTGLAEDFAATERVRTIKLWGPGA
jgi:hypothetical protein